MSCRFLIVLLLCVLSIVKIQGHTSTTFYGDTNCTSSPSVYGIPSATCVLLNVNTTLLIGSCVSGGAVNFTIFENASDCQADQRVHLQGSTFEQTCVALPSNSLSFVCETGILLSPGSSSSSWTETDTFLVTALPVGFVVLLITLIIFIYLYRKYPDMCRKDYGLMTPS